MKKIIFKLVLFLIGAGAFPIYLLFFVRGETPVWLGFTLFGLVTLVCIAGAGHEYFRLQTLLITKWRGKRFDYD